MSASPDNVDICVTCICDKPPKLPLREELPSLGIEVIYNAKGVGAEATEKETKKEIERIGKLRMKSKKDKDRSTRSRRSLLSPPGLSPLSRKFGKSGLNKMDPPEDFAIPKALSYGSYQRTLDIRTKEESKSVTSSIETSSSMDEKDRRYKKKKKKLAKRLRGLFSQKRDPNLPPRSVEFPNSQTIEEAALTEAFNAFMIDDDVDVPPKPRNIQSKTKNTGGNKDIFPDLLPGGKDNPEQVEENNDPKSGAKEVERVTDSSSSGVDQTTVSSLGNDSSTFKKNLVYDAEAFSKQAQDRLSKLASDHDTSPVVQKKGSGGNIKVKLLGNPANDHITEIYDLTEISEAGNEYSQEEDKRHILSPQHRDIPDTFQDNDWNDVVYLGSSPPTSPNSLSHKELSVNSDESSVPVPQMLDAFGRSILDVSNVYEENGPGSPLVLSPVPRREYSDFNFSSSSFDIPQYGQEKKRESPYLPSFLNNNSLSDNEFVHDGRDDIVVYRVESETSSFRERNLSPVKLEIASPYRAPTSRAHISLIDSERSKSGLNMKSISFDEVGRTKRFSNLTYSSPSKLVPAIRKSASRDSYESLKSPKVSFSEDIEERRYFNKEKFEYEKSMSNVKSSLAAIVNEGRELTEPLPSEVSRDAEEAFRSFTDQLDAKEYPRTPEQILLEALSYGDPLPFDFEETIKLNPSIASQPLPHVDTYALHSACLRAFPKRFANDQTCRVIDLVNDLHMHRKLIEALVAADPETCRRVDSKGDLPAHIMARHLMEWEGQWYQKVYNKASGQDNDQDSGVGITKLYQSMSECMNVLLEPIIVNDSLCLQSGSVGRILPLHIAAIFTVPYNTLKSLLEAFPNAASVRCDLSDIKTFVPSNSTPLELHDRLSTDFPKWEIQRANYDPDEEMTQFMLDKMYKTKNGMRRSDLMFAFSPKLLPYRKEAYRIGRMEEMIQNEMKDQEEEGNFVLTRPSEKFWVWLCEFQDDDDASDHYAESISRIIDPLTFRSVRFLASVLNGEGNPIVDKAVPSCADAIMKKLDTIAKTQIPFRVQSPSPNLDMTIRSLLLSQFDEETSKRLRLHGQGLVGPLCRTIFNITETAYPTSFVILPYKLVKDAEGRLGLESSEAAHSAMKFAEFLSTLTTPKSIIDTIDQKIEENLGENIVDEMNRASRETRRKHFTEFLKLYENEPAYFYFVDDCSGIPIVDEKRGIYPLIISDAADVIEKVFPMMLSGMILMRGEKSISILADVLLDDTIKTVMPHWIEAAKDLIGFTLSSNGEYTPSFEILLPLQEKLTNFVMYGPTENEVINKLQSDGLSTEWVVETSLIKMILEMHDPRHFFCDLLQERATAQVMWTLESQVVNGTTKQIDFIPIKTLKHSNSGFGRRAYENHSVAKETSYGKAEAKSMSDSDYSSGEYTGATSEDEMPGMIITTKKTKNSENVRSELDNVGNIDPYSPRELPESRNDHAFNLDSVVELRVKLDEQEAKLHSLRRKISYLGTAGDELEQGEEKITNMINEIVNQKDILQVPSRDGLEKAKALLQRICELEDRVMCREVEVGQLKNDVSVFQLEVSGHSKSRRSNKTVSSSSSSHHDEARSLREMSDPINEEMRVHDDEIQSMDSGGIVNFNQMDDLNDGDDSTVGNSTMYNSSVDGYSYSAGMLRH